MGVFYAPVYPIPDAIVLEYRQPMSRLARRFFHKLLRYKWHPLFLCCCCADQCKTVTTLVSDLLKFSYFVFMLRYSRFEKAFLLAKDIGERDLFMVGKINLTY